MIGASSKKSSYLSSSRSKKWEILAVERNGDCTMSVALVRIDRHGPHALAILRVRMIMCSLMPCDWFYNAYGTVHPGTTGRGN